MKNINLELNKKTSSKDKQENLHIFYLSATPIPRTMNMVFSGLKDFSFLQTAPSNRINIKSFVKIYTTQLIKEALSREKLEVVNLLFYKMILEKWNH